MRLAGLVVWSHMQKVFAEFANFSKNPVSVDKNTPLRATFLQAKKAPSSKKNRKETRPYASS